MSVEVWGMAIGLAMDATAASIGIGASGRAGPREALTVGGLFGGFQAGMPVVGWLVGERLSEVAAAWDHWVALGLLVVIGGRMLREGWSPDPEAPPKETTFGSLVVLAIATSIDALAAGLTLPLFEVPIAFAVAIIGAVTAVLSFLGVALGRRIGERVGGRLEIAGGLVLIALGLKIFVEHQLGGA